MTSPASPTGFTAASPYAQLHVDGNDVLSLNLSYWILQSIAMIVTALLLPRLTITSIFGAIGIVVALAFVNSKLWDAALFFQIPNSLTAHTAALLLANGLIFWILVKLLPGIEVQGVLPAIAAPVVFTVCSIVISTFAADIDWHKVWTFTVEFFNSIKLYMQGAATELRSR